MFLKNCLTPSSCFETPVNVKMQVPSFSCQQPDMVVPQPVYMNMDDLASLAGQREDSCEEGLDLKTPTQVHTSGS